MTVRVRAAGEGEAVDLLRVDATAFGRVLTSEEVEDGLSWLEHARLLAAEDGGALAGSAGAFSFDMTVPGGVSMPAAGVTLVGVLPTHRRRGVATALMRRQLDDVAERGEAIAVLTASEASIYGRFGYGLATRLARVKLHTTGGLPLVAEPATGGRFRLLSAEDAEPHARRLIEAARAVRVGELTRPPWWWPVFLRDAEYDRHGASARFWVAHEPHAGEVDGVAHYRVREHWGDDDAVPRNEVELGDVWTADPEVEAALLSYVASVDLTASLTTWSRPVDDPFRLRLVDDRRYRVLLHHDHLYLRLVDVCAALAAREYDVDEPIVLGVDDAFRPTTSGRYRLEGATCERVGDLHDGDADAFLTIDALASLYLGDVTAWQLAAAGRLLPASDAALDVVGRRFRTARAPFSTMRF